MEEIFDHTGHRPWPLPQRRWALAMRWYDLLFAHWPVPPEVLRPLIPAALNLDLYDGRAWIGIVPFCMRGVRLRYMPESLSFDFPELNVRTYVTSPHRSGVWFFSLDATNRLAVRAARLWYGLLYYDAEIQVHRHGQTVEYQSIRKGREASLQVRYLPVGSCFQAQGGSIDHWLTERYGLYADGRKGKIRFGDIHHPRWQLQKAEADFRINTMTDCLGFSLPDQKPVLHFAQRQHMVAWRIKLLNRS
ncbi:MAG: DUF2071 domain-containing protein [Balneolales bacterium]